MGTWVTKVRHKCHSNSPFIVIHALIDNRKIIILETSPRGLITDNVLEFGPSRQDKLNPSFDDTTKQDSNKGLSVITENISMRRSMMIRSLQSRRLQIQWRKDHRQY